MNAARLLRLLRLTRHSATAGAVVWVVALAVVHPVPVAVEWGHLLLLLAPLVLVPLGMRLLTTGLLSPDNRLLTLASIVQLPAALLLGGAYLLEQGIVAGVLAMPWLLVTGLLALAGAARLFRRRPPWAEAGLDAALLFLPVGAIWVVADRYGERPLDFDPVIVLLTGIHFHYAGFVLPLAAGLAGRRRPGWIARLATTLIVAGVPLTAVGITASQLGAGGALECAAAWVMAAGGTLAGVLHLRLAAARTAPTAARLLWGLAGLALVFGMTLAALYGTRFYLPIAWLDVPWMRALHGSANALGFALAALGGWVLARGWRGDR
jgi:hypothetical protein